jgi:hypothetical protein
MSKMMREGISEVLQKTLVLWSFQIFQATRVVIDAATLRDRLVWRTSVDRHVLTSKRSAHKSGDIWWIRSQKNAALQILVD